MEESIYKFKLYIVDQSEETIQQVEMMKALFNDALKEEYTLELIDMLDNPELVADNQIKVSPTLILELPPPSKKLEGTLPGKEKLLLALNILNVNK